MNNLTNHREWREFRKKITHDLHILNEQITTTKEELIQAITKDVFPIEKREDLIRFQKEKESLKRILKALDRNIEGVESEKWFPKMEK